MISQKFKGIGIIFKDVNIEDIAEKRSSLKKENLIDSIRLYYFVLP